MRTGLEKILFVKSPLGGTVTIAIELNATVEDLKVVLERKEGIPIEQQRLIYAGRHMKNGRLVDYNIVSECCTIHCVLRLRGC